MEESGGKEIQQDAGLVNEITLMIETSEPSMSFGYHINRVPDYLRKVNEEAYTPKIISIGPIHNLNEKLQFMVKYKVIFLKSFIHRKGIKTDLENLVRAVREMEQTIYCCYADTIAPSSDAFVKMILMDAIFILELFLIAHDMGKESGKRDNGEDSHKIDKSLIAEEEMEAEKDIWMGSLVTRDLLLLENQLPFFVLEKLYDIAFPDCSDSPSLVKLTFNYFEYYNIEKMTPENLSTTIKHFTHLLRTFQLYSPQKLPERKGGIPKLLYSATQLHEAGVKFRVSRSKKSLLGINFDLKSGVLEIPCLTLFDSTEFLIRNIIALEQQGNAYVTDYFAVLDFLINTTKDIDLLCNEEIVVNYLGDSNAATSVVKKLNTNVILYDMNSKYMRICEELNTFYEKRWHRWKAAFTHQYFSGPWKAAIILLVLTLIQTVCSIIQVAPKKELK